MENVEATKTKLIGYGFQLLEGEPHYTDPLENYVKLFFLRHRPKSRQLCVRWYNSHASSPNWSATKARAQQTS